MNGRRVMVATVGVCCVAASLVAGTAFAAEPSFPYIDVNNNGAYDTGLDSGDATAMLTSGMFRTSLLPGARGTEGVVIPAKAKLVGDSMDIEAGGNVVINGDVSAGGMLSFRSTFGSVLVGSRTRITSAGQMDLQGQDDVIIGNSAKLSCPDQFSWSDITLRALSGDVLIGERAVVDAAGRVNLQTLTSSNGAIVLGKNAKMTGVRNLISAGGSVSMTGATCEGSMVVITSAHGDVDMRDSTYRAKGDGWGRLVAASGGVTDVRGMRCVNVPTQNMSLWGVTVLR